jgi:protein tyrosine/serine phosphatase
MIREEIPDLLFATSRPGYDYGANEPVSLEVVSQWIAEAKSVGAKSILCLLNEQHLKLYGGLPTELLQAYRDAGFEVGHVPVVDHQRPPLSGNELKAVEQFFNELPKPVLIHCSAGIDRTGAAVRHLKTLPSDSTN